MTNQELLRRQSGDFVRVEHNLELPRHRWYTVKEGFSASLVQRGLSSVGASTKRIKVLDPFSGSGTTALVAASMGHAVTAVEVNPFMHFVGTTKCWTSSRSYEAMVREVERILDAGPIERESPLEGLSTFGPRDGAEKWLFNRSVLRGFEALRVNIARLAVEREPLMLALIGAAMDCANVRRDGKCLRYKKGWQESGSSSLELRERFAARARVIAKDLEESPLSNCQPIFINGDVREEIERIEEGFEFIVFSPPYVNSFDYSDVYRPELFLGGFVQNNKDLRELRSRTLRSHLQYSWTEFDEFESETATKVLERLVERMDFLWDRRIPDMISSYFADMRRVIAEALKIASPGAQMWIVVGTSAYGGVEVPVDTVLGEIAAECGWDVLGIDVLRRLRAASQHHVKAMTDSLGEKVTLRESLIRCTK